MSYAADVDTGTRCYQQALHLSLPSEYPNFPVTTAFVFSNHLLVFYCSHQRVRHFTRSPRKLLLLKAGIRAPRQQMHFQTK